MTYRWTSLVLLAVSLPLYAQGEQEEEAQKPLEILITDGQKEAQQPLNTPSSIATGNKQLWKDIPASVSVFNQPTIEAYQPDRLEDLADYSPAIQEGRDSGRFNTTVFARGFDSLGRNIFLNGHPDILRYHVRDMGTLEQAEILKGHNASLYGEGTPGASMQYQTKKPKGVNRRTVELSTGSNNLKRADFDIEGFSQENNLGYRVVGAVQDTDKYRNTVEDDRRFLFSSVEKRIGDKSKVRFDIEHMVNNRPFEFGTIYRDGKVLYDQAYGDPRTKSKREYNRSGLYIDHMLNQNWKVSGFLHHVKVDRDDLLFGYLYKIDDDNLQGYYRDVNDSFFQRNMQIGVTGATTHNTIKNNVDIGVGKDYSNTDLISERSFGFTIDPLNPIYPENTPETHPRNNQVVVNNKYLYIKNNTKVGDDWVFTAGGRYSDYHTLGAFAGGALDTVTQKKHLAKNLGVLRNINKNISAYGSFSESFQPQFGQDRNDNFFEPVRAVQKEIGVKASFFNKVDLQVSAYDLEQYNLTTRDPDAPEFQILAGKRRTQGVEVEATANINPSVGIGVGYAYMDAEYTKNNNGLQGKTPSSVPKHSGHVRIHWTPSGNKNFTYSAGLIGVGKRWGDDSNTFKVAGYERLDLSARYKRKNMSVTASVKNALDKKYVVTSFGEGFVDQGYGRNAKLTFEYRF